MSRLRPLGGIAALALVLAAGACGREGEAQLGGPGGMQGGRGGRGGMPIGPVPVGVAQVELGSIARAVTVSGVVEPIRTVGVNSQMAGALLSISAQEGDLVAEGTVLARLDDREIQAQIEAAEASFQVAEAALERASQLRERRVITLPEYERDRTAHAAARAQLDQLRTRAGYATIRAPIHGMVVEKLVEAGDVVGNQSRLFTLADISTLVVRVGVSELDVVELSVGQSTDVTLDALPGRPFAGRILRIFPTADPATRLVPVEVGLEPAARSVVKPGFLARVRFALAERRDVMLVPAGAIVGAGGSQNVFVVQDGRVTRRTVEPGLTSEGRVEVRSGLQVGDVIVSVGNNALRDGSEVRVMAGAVDAEGLAGAAGGDL